MFKFVSTLGVLAIVNAIGFAVVVVLFAKWLWILIALVLGVGGGFLLLRWARTLADPPAPVVPSGGALGGPSAH